MKNEGIRFADGLCALRAGMGIHVVGRCLGAAEIHYTVYAKIAEEQLLLWKRDTLFLKIDQYVIMPNHIHAIFILEKAAGASPRPTVKDKPCISPLRITRFGKWCFFVMAPRNADVLRLPLKQGEVARAQRVTEGIF